MESVVAAIDECKKTEVKCTPYLLLSINREESLYVMGAERGKSDWERTQRVKGDREWKDCCLVLYTGRVLWRLYH